MKQAFATLISNGEKYIPGVEVLGRSIKNTGTDRDLVLLSTEDLSPDATRKVEAQGWSVQRVEPIINPIPDEDHLFKRFQGVYTKLRAWEIADYDKVVFLDADTLVIRNIDELFERPYFAAAPCFFLPDRFNSGVMVLEPSLETLEKMIDSIPKLGSYDGGDQGFLNSYFTDWYKMSEEFRLPIRYNLHNFIYQFLSNNEMLWRKISKEIKIIHYTLMKPWLTVPAAAGATSLWWDVYYQIHPEKRTAIKDKIHEAYDWTFNQIAWFLSR